MELAGRLTRGMVVVEWVGAEDAQYRRLLRGRSLFDKHHDWISISSGLRTAFPRQLVKETCSGHRKLGLFSIQ